MRVRKQITVCTRERKEEIERNRERLCVRFEETERDEIREK